MAKKKLKLQFPPNQYGWIPEDDPNVIYTRDTLDEIAQEMLKGESWQVGVYKLERIVNVTKKSVYEVK